MRRTVALCVLAKLSILCAGAQSDVDTAFVRTAFASTAKIYYEFIGVQSGLINGTEYKEPPSREGQHPYFVDNDWTTGDVKYFGQWYRETALMYNVSSDQVIAENPVNGQEIQLVKIKVAEFNLHGRRFIHRDASDLAGLPEPGFYEVLHDGTSHVLARHRKTYEEKIENSALVLYYTPKTRYFIKSGNAYVRVSGKRDVLKIFGDRKNELRVFMRSRNLKISKSNPDAYAAVAAYYDSLKRDQ